MNPILYQRALLKARYLYNILPRVPIYDITTINATHQLFKSLTPL